MAYQDLTFGGKRRDRTGVICDLLVEARRGASITELIYKTNLNHKLCKDYIDFLLRRILLDVRNSNDQALYVTTKRGEDFLHHYTKLREMFLQEEPRRIPVT